MATSVVDVIENWREQLADWSEQNPLLSFPEDHPFCLTCTQPAAGEVFAHLLAGKRWSFDGGSDHPLLICRDTDGDELARRLTRLHHRTQQVLLDRGITGLYIVGGLLVWTDDDDELHRSPLVLLPIGLTRDALDQPFALHADDQEPLVNPALAVRLKRDFDLRLPTLPQLNSGDFLGTYFQEVEASIAGLDGRLEQTVHLLPASLGKYFAYHVFQQHGEAIRRHPFVQVLSGEKSAKTLTAAPIPEETELDSMEHTESLPVLDVDGRQHLCLEAAARGHSFLVQAPPGTGKGQTITNLIAGSLAKGQSTLVVGVKQSALNSIYEHLKQLGLDEYCLPLHRMSSGRQVLADLKSCLQKAEQKQDIEELPPLDWTKWIAYRLRLNGYVQALHHVREPLMRSVWSVLEELAQWEDLPALALGLPLTRSESDESEVSDQMPVVAEIGPGWIEEATENVKRLQQLWHLRPPTATDDVDDKPDSPWYGLKADRFTKQLRDDLLGLIDRVLSRLERLAKVANEFAQTLALPANLSWLLSFADLLDARPKSIPATWLQENDSNGMEKELASCEASYQARAQGRAPLTEKYGQDLWNLPEGTADRVDETWQAASAFLSPQDAKGKMLLAHQQKLRGWAADTQTRIPNWISDLRTLEKWLGVPVPLGAEPDAGSKLDPSPDVIRQYMRLVHLCQSETPPERTWVHKKEVLDAAKKAISQQQPVFEKLQKRRDALLRTFQESVFELELDRIAEAFDGPYQSKLRFFNGQFRKDRRAIKRRLRGEKMPADYVEHIKEARDIQIERKRLESEHDKRKEIMGRYEKGFDTDFNAAEHASRIAEEVVVLVRELGCESIPARMMDALCAGTKPTGKIRAAGKRLHDSFSEWHHTTQELAEALPMSQLPIGGQPLDESALSNLNRYGKNLQGRLNQLAGLADSVLVKAPHPPEDAVTLVADLRHAEQFLVSEDAQPADEEKWQKRFGPMFQGVTTNWDELRKQLQWVKQIHKSFTEVGDAKGKPPDAFVQWISSNSSSSVSTRDLRHAHEQYLHALHSLEHRFDEPGPLHDGQPLAKLGPEAVQQHLQGLRERVDDLPEWIDWRKLPDRFGQLGLGAFWEALLEKPPARDYLVSLFHKSFWHHWVDAICRSDDALSKFRSAEHHRIRQEYCELDKRVQQQNAQRAQLEARGHRRDTLGGLADADKKINGDAPTILRLTESAPQLVRALKPCILATPETVARFMPAEKYGADIVIVDDASLLNCADAACLFFRGKQVLCFGDEHQLHPAFNDPTEEAAELTAVQESVVETIVSKGMWKLELSNHYRSRHERLIAFSNVHYYDQRLWTFPANKASHSAAGLQLHHVDGAVYDPAEHINPSEIECVVKLVTEHAKRQSNQSLGVVTGTPWQAHAIWEALLENAKKNNALATLMTTASDEPFFVTEVDLAQSEERDVMIVSVTLAQQHDKQWPTDYLGWSREEGARRVNVACTGARQILHIVKSLKAKELTGSADTLTALRAFLEFAEQNVDEPPRGLRRDGQIGRIQKVVIDALNEMGHKAVADVGWGAHPLPVAVLDDKNKGQFLLAVELDGASYHESPTARDRDRVRPAMLQQQGWRMHRVSSLGWWKDRDAERQRLQDSLQSSKNESKEVRETSKTVEKQLPKETKRASVEKTEPASTATGKGRTKKRKRK